MLRDLLHAVRMLRQSKGWTAVVLLSLALGIGANTALFTAVNGLLLQTVPVPDPGAGPAEVGRRQRHGAQHERIRVIAPYNGKRVTRDVFVSRVSRAAQGEQDADRSRGLSRPTAASTSSSTARRRSGERRSSSAATTSRCSRRAAARPVAAEDDDQPGAPPVAVISHAFWRKRFASDPRSSASRDRSTTAGHGRRRDARGFAGIQRLGRPART